LDLVVQNFLEDLEGQDHQSNHDYLEVQMVPEVLWHQLGLVGLVDRLQGQWVLVDLHCPGNLVRQLGRLQGLWDLRVQ
jgi:hypothetical protein